MPETHEILTEKDAATARKAAEILSPEDGQMYGLARVLAKSDIIPKAMQDKPANVFLILMKAKLLQISAGEALENVMVVNGRTAVWGDLFLALIQRSPDYEWHKEWYEGTFPEDNYTAICEIKRKGIEGAFRGEFSVADAKRAKLWGDTRRDPWIKYPKDMLKRRARTRAGRDGFADALKGITTVEEMRDTIEPKTGGRIRFGGKPDARRIEVEVEDVTEKGGATQPPKAAPEQPAGSASTPAGSKPPSPEAMKRKELVETITENCNEGGFGVPLNLEAYSIADLTTILLNTQEPDFDPKTPLAQG